MICCRRNTVSAFLLLVAALCLPAQQAPGAPGTKPTWTNGNKVGVGTSAGETSKVWFTLGENGALNEVYYPAIDSANTRTLELIVTDGKSFAELESEDTVHAVEVPDPAALVFTQINTSKSGRYQIRKTYITDPRHDTVLIQMRLKVLHGGPLTAFVYFDPALKNSGLHDNGSDRNKSLLDAKTGVACALAATPTFVSVSSGYAGSSDGWTELKTSYKLTRHYSSAPDGNVAQIAELPQSFSGGKPVTVALGFGGDADAALAAVKASLTAGFAGVRAEYEQGWHQYIATLKKVEPRYRKQYQISAMVLKAHEDKTHRGAIAASLTIPWGNEVDSSKEDVGGYHLVWARDLYEVATAFLAMGDRAAAERALNYLFETQQKADGSFPQNSWLDGKPYWPSLQMDEVSYPSILAWQLGKTDKDTFEKHVKPAANFVVAHGPVTPQERWEEKSGYSPSTIAAEIAGLICAADIAHLNGDEASRSQWTATADEWARKLPQWTVTHTGKYADQYYIRIAQKGQPDVGGPIDTTNGGGIWDEREIVDAGFLELVRLGIVPPDDPVVIKSLAVVDKVIRVETPNGATFYRYNHDGYGEKPDGHGYDGTGIGRLWIIFAGERGEYELASGRDAHPYLDAMQKMSNADGMLAEQVWDRPESPRPWLKFGQGTGSATPLAWTNAQFIRLAIAVKERNLPELPAVVRAHFVKSWPVML
ncbi:MAG TPA: glycoside hydrolase family 15 protein [Verrucomicrobiae bacterium]|jgi:glucan 1,4-alpha-glucosidase|nr:glycoside hydrolase family 15 protein [Verrucomicrobiae bacterium]